MKEYPYDIAISLCKQDVEFANKLIKELNPGLKVFFYADKQEELVTKSGPEEFANIFKNKSRIVVILSRKEWGESYYTEIERNAILERIAMKNEGYGFLMVIPIEPNEKPSWYPSTHIYVNPLKFSLQDIARFIEYKLTEEGGTIKEITPEERYQNILQRIEAKKEIVELQQSEQALEQARLESVNFKELFNVKVDFFKNCTFEVFSHKKFSGNSGNAHFQIGQFKLDFKVFTLNPYNMSIYSSQDYVLNICLTQSNEMFTDNKIIYDENRTLHYTPEKISWAIMKEPEEMISQDRLLFQSSFNGNLYDLVDLKSSAEIVEFCFHKLLIESTKSFEKHL